MTVTNFQMSTVDLCHPIYVTYILYLDSNSPRLTFSSLSSSIIPIFFTPLQEVKLNNYLVLHFITIANDMFVPLKSVLQNFEKNLLYFTPFKSKNIKFM